MTSIYEQTHEGRRDIESGITFGRVTSVNIAKRMVTVKTFLGKGIMDDMHIPNCQWISLDAHPDGDETLSIPRKNTIGLVFFVGGEPFFFGGIRGLNADAGAVTGNEAEKRLLEGDKVISTSSGNRVVLKASRLIDIISTELLKRTYSPKDNRIIDLCSNYQLTADGGSILWENQGRPTNFTLFDAEYADGINRTSILRDRIGQVSTSRIFQRDMGVGIPTLRGTKLPLYSEYIDKDGTHGVAVGPNGVFTRVVKPDGSWVVKNLGITVEVSPTGAFSAKNKTSGVELSDSGDLSYENPTVKISAAAKGDINVSNPTVNISASSDGEFKLDSSQAVAEFGKGKFEISGPAGKLMDTMSNILQNLIDLTTAMQSETHVGNMGYNTSPPVNSAQYIQVQTGLTQLKTIVDLLKK